MEDKINLSQFQKAYVDAIAPLLNNIEKSRKNMIKDRFLKLFALTFIGIALIVLFEHFLKISAISGLIIASLILYAVYTTISANISYKTFLNKCLMKKLLTNLGKINCVEESLNEFKNVIKGQIVKSKLFEDAEEIRINDAFSLANDCKIVEANISYNNPNKFFGFLIIKPKNSFKMGKAITCNYDYTFEEYSDIGSSDLKVIKPLLPDDFAKKLISARTVFNIKTVKFSFYEDNIILAIETRKKLFEIGNIFKPITNPDNITKFYMELNTIFEIINSLNLEKVKQ